MIGEPAEKLDIASQDNAEENLKAIRKMLTDQEKRPATSSTEPSDALPVPSSPNESEPMSVPHSTLVAPSSKSVTAQFKAPAKLPWTPPSVSQPGPPDRSVPAYTIPAPVGPNYSGTIRCVPDGLGGQRCR